MPDLSTRAFQMRQRGKRKRAREKKIRKKKKDQANSKPLTWKPRYLYLIDIEEVRRTKPRDLENALTHCEKISYKAWKDAKKRRARRKPEKWYLVKNPPEPFLPVTAERLKSYLGKSH